MLTRWITIFLLIFSSTACTGRRHKSTNPEPGNADDSPQPSPVSGSQPRTPGTGPVIVPPVDDADSKDRSPPTASLTSRTSSPTNQGPILIDVGFSESVTDFNASDIVVTGGSVTFVTGTDSNYVIEIAPTGIVTVSLPEGSAHDAAGNASVAASLTVVFDNIAPIIEAGSAIMANTGTTLAPTITEALPFTVVWSQVGSAGTVQFSDTHATTPVVSADAEGIYTLHVVVTDQAGNSASDDLTFVWDVTPPTIGNSAGLTISDRGVNGMQLNWIAATDSMSNVSYKACASTEPNDLLTIADMDGAACVVVIDYTANVTSASTRSFASKTNYYLRVVAADVAGNKTLYNLQQERTLPIAHVTYWDDTQEEVGYATNATGNFAAISIPGACPADMTTSCGKYTSLRLDRNNRPHVTYTRNNGNWPTLFYIEKTETGWDNPVELAPASTVTWNDFQIDSVNNIHLAFYEKTLNFTTTNDLKYMYRDGSSWSEQRIYSSGSSGEHVALALNSNDVPFVSFYKNGSNDDLYVSNLDAGLDENGEWLNTQAVDKPGITGLFTSIGIDATGAQHVSYYDADHATLKYASDARGSWAIRSIDQSAQVGQYSKLAVVRRGTVTTVHVLYYDMINGDLKHVTCTADSSSNDFCSDNAAIWQKQTVAQDGDVGTWIGVDFDPFGFLHVSFYDATASRSMYTYAALDVATGLWRFSVPEQVDNSGKVGSYSAIQVER